MDQTALGSNLWQLEAMQRGVPYNEYKDYACNFTEIGSTVPTIQTQSPFLKHTQFFLLHAFYLQLVISKTNLN